MALGHILEMEYISLCASYSSFRITIAFQSIALEQYLTRDLNFGSIPCTTPNKNTSTKYWYFYLEAPPGFEPGDKSFADSCLTTWPWRHLTYFYTIAFCVKLIKRKKLFFSKSFYTLLHIR